MNIRALVAEAVGTFTLVGFGSLGIASIVFATSGQPGGLILLAIPLGFGFGLLAAIAIGGHVSGGHFNPAVTLAAALDGRVSWLDAIGYVVAQAVGAFGASLTMLLLLSKDFVGATVNHPASGWPTANGDFNQDATNGAIHAFGVEVILTMIFVAVILTVTRQSPNHAIFVIPLTLFVIHVIGVPLSGASVNPIRSLAPAVVSGDYNELWVYLSAPFAGSILGWAIYRILSPGDEPLEGDLDLTADEDEELDDLELDEADDADDAMATPPAPRPRRR